MTTKEKFTKTAIERINIFLASINVVDLKIEEINLSDSFIEFQNMQCALNYFKIDTSEKLTDFGSWEELSNKHILFMF